MLAALDHDGNNVPGFLERRETGKPSNGILVTAISSLGSASLACNLYLLQTRSPTGSPVFINNFPKALPHEFDLIGRQLLAQIPSHSRRLRHCHVAVLVQHRRTILVQDLFNHAWVIADAAVSDRRVSHCQLQWRNQSIALAD